MQDKNTRPTIAVIDGNSLMHRAYHAVPPYMTAPDGRPTNAAFGFMQMFVKLIETFSVWGVIVCFDKGKPRARMELLPSYKANRPPQDEALHQQFPMIKELLAALSIPVVELEGWEGDDLLGTIAKKGAKQGFDFLLFTGDRDMYQLSDEHIKIVNTKKGLSDVAIMDPAAVKDLYAGITPELVPDFYGLKGDSSDNIPGVPGIGPKKAAALIQEYGSLKEVLAHAKDIKGKMGENIQAHAQDALLSKKVATILCDAPIELDIRDSEFPNFDQAVAQEAFQKLAFTLIEKRFFAATGTTFSHAPNKPSSLEAETVQVGEVISGKEAEKELERAIAAQTWLGVSFEEKEVLTLIEPSEVLFVKTDQALCAFEGTQAKEMLAHIVRKGRLSALGVKELLHVLCPANTALPKKISVLELEPSRLFDASIAAYLLNSSVTEYSAEMLARNYLHKGIELEEASAQEEAVIAYELTEPLTELLEKNGSKPCFDEIEMPLVLVLSAMERGGLFVDKAVLADQTRSISKKVDKLKEEIFSEAGESFNIASPSQLSRILFDVLMLPHEGMKRTKKGFISTNATLLEDLAKNYSIVRNVLLWREYTKIITTYLETLPDAIASDGRIHTTFNQTVTTTGRLSSSNPNLQNIPVKSDLGRAVREAFVVKPDHYFLAADYSQIELRLLAHLSGDAGLIEAFKQGSDFHSQTAAKVFGVAPEDVTPEQRRRAKAVNFGIVYGQQAFGLSRVLSISNKEAQAMIDAYYLAYPAVRTYLDTTVQEAKRLGFAETMYGRRRLLPELRATNRMVVAAGEREAMNLPMQGSAADIIKLAMISVERRLHKENCQAKLLLQIHDELDFEVPQDELETVSKLVQEEMEGVVELLVPLVASISYGRTWAEAK